MTSWKIEDLLTLREVANLLNTEPDPRRVLDRVIDTALKVVGAERGFLIVIGEDKTRIAVARNMDAEDVKNPEAKFSHNIAMRVFSSEKPLVLSNAKAEDGFSGIQSVLALGVTSLICLPFRVQGKTLGVLYIENRHREGVFGAYQTELLEAFCSEAAITYENVRMKAELEKLNKKLRERVSEQERTIEDLRGKLVTLSPTSGPSEYHGWLIGRSAAMQRVYTLLDKVSESEATVLITGESGTGKELVARALHAQGLRKDRPFLAVNCGALHDQLLESELFGHVRGAFTGATRDRAGLFEAADGGTVFLDEIGDTTPALQAKLLRVLQDGSFIRVGETTTRRAHVRVIAATNRNLATYENFRKDLYFRLRVIEIAMPSLRERREDIPLLVDHFVKKHGRGEAKLPEGALERLAGWDWPGNVRELENEIQRLLLLGDKALEPSSAAMTPRTLDEATRAFQYDFIQQVITRHKGNKTRAAEELGISREWLTRRVKELEP